MPNFDDPSKGPESIETPPEQLLDVIIRGCRDGDATSYATARRILCKFAELWENDDVSLADCLEALRPLVEKEQQ